MRLAVRLHVKAAKGLFSILFLWGICLGQYALGAKGGVQKGHHHVASIGRAKAKLKVPIGERRQKEHVRIVHIRHYNIRLGNGVSDSFRAR
jgi:hypothetical protein